MDEKISELEAIITPADADIVPVVNGIGETPVSKKITWANIKATLKSYFDSLYTLANLGGVPTSRTVNSKALSGNITLSASDVGAMASAGGTMTGKLTQAGRDEVGKSYTPGTGAQGVALDCSLNNIHNVVGHADGTAITFTISGATNNQPFIVNITQGAVVSTIAGWFATIRWVGGSAPTLTATANKRDTFGFIRTGTNTYDGYVVGQNI